MVLNAGCQGEEAKVAKPRRCLRALLLQPGQAGDLHFIVRMVLRRLEPLLHVDRTSVGKREKKLGQPSAEY